MSTLQKRSIRCAVYTRKSSEEGLEQSFNSLDARREACQAYILSQRQEGWRAINAAYDDGGFSGGSMERPGLKRLMGDIEARKVDTVVVYKVDRLTRSLADFAKMVEAFDARGVSFVSVTQQFNTTSSMGRLTLNVLLSFAQFEREVTGERIRDKIAASKRKGMWMGGMIPLGYDLKDRHLILNEKEAEHVREIFRLYLEIGCVKKLKAHFDQRGVKSKIRVSRSGNSSGGTTYSRGALYKILQNRIYLGGISAQPPARSMPSRSLRKEDTSTVHEPASRGDGRHCSLCWTGICGTQPQVDQLATPKSVAGYRALPNRCAGRTSRSLHRLRTYDQDLLQLVQKQALPKMPGQRAPALAQGARAGTAAYSLCARRLYPAAGTGNARVAEQAAHLQPALSLQRRDLA